MRVYLIRHGEAQSAPVGGERHLTFQGCMGIERVGVALRERGVRVATVWHSGKARARGTAEIVAKSIGAPEPAVRNGLAPEDPVAPVRDALDARDDDVMLVGHLPFVADLCALLLGGAADTPPGFGTGDVVCLERAADGQWTIDWSVRASAL